MSWTMLWGELMSLAMKRPKLLEEESGHLKWIVARLSIAKDMLAAAMAPFHDV